MSQQGDTGVNQSGSISQDTRTMSARNGKRYRGQNDEQMHLAASGMADQCVEARVSSDILPSGGGENGTDSQKRFKCSPSTMENVDTVAKGHTLGMEEPTQFHCDICSVTSTSAKDLKTHLSGKKHAKRMELARSKAKLSTPQENQGLLEYASTHLNVSNQALMENVASHSNTNMGIISMGQEVVLDSLQNNLSREYKGHLLSCAGGTDVEVVNFQASSSKCPDLDDANAVAVGQQASIDVPLKEQVSKNDSSSRPAFDDGHVTNEILHSPAHENDIPTESNKCMDDGHVTNKTVHSPAPADNFPKESNEWMDDGHVTNGTVHNSTPAGDFRKESNKRAIFEGQPIKSVLASLNTRSNSDCVAQALASALSAYACPGLGDLQKGAICGQAAGCSDSQAGGAMSADSHGMVKMHAHCFVNLLHDVRVSAIEDLFRHVMGEERNGSLETKTWLPDAAPASGSACDGETVDLNCTVCRVEYGSKADLDLHLAGKKHTSLVRRLGSRCQLCNLNCNSEREFETHLNGRKHASKLRLLRKRVTF